MTPTVTELTSYAARTFGRREAVRFPGESALTFAQIDKLAARFAAGLARLGLEAGDRVVLHLPNSWQWIIAYHAIARLGAVSIPANILLSSAEIAYIAENAGASLAILPPERADDLPPGLRAITTGPTGAIPFESLLRHTGVPPRPASPDELCSICYTSGTTGRPKGAMLTHGNIIASINMTATVHVRTARDRVYSALPFPHVYGNVVLNAGFLSGNHLTATSRFNAADALRAIDEDGITLFEGVPTMYYQMLVHPALDTTAFGSLTRCTVGGQTMPLDKLNAVIERFGCPLLELWGMTELAGPAITHSPYWPPRLGSIGLPFPATFVRIVDLEDGQAEASPGNAGELLIRGPLVTTGYWNDEAATAGAMRDGWFATGDVALKDADGYVTIVDRRKDMFLCGGYNIYPAELERVISEHPAVAMVAVAGIADDEKGEIPVAHIVLRPEAESTPADEIARHCRDRLAAYKIPRRIHFTDALPVTSTGKIMRRALKEKD